MAAQHLAIELDPLIKEARTRMRRRRVLLALVLALVVALALALTLAWRPGGPHGSPGGGAPARSGSGNAQVRARVTADKLLQRMILPPGATRVSEQTAGSAAGPPNWGTSTYTQFEYRQGYWQVRQPVATVMEFFKQHPPPGFVVGAVVVSGAIEPFVWFDGVSVGGRIASKMYASIVPSHRVTIIRVDAGVPWTVPRSPSSLVPTASVREIDIRRGASGVMHRVTSPRAVALITRWFNSLNVVQPNTMVLCANGAAWWVQFIFRSATGAKVASAFVPPGPASSCTEIGFTLHGQRQAPLIDSTPEGGMAFVYRVQRLIGSPLVPSHRR